MMIYTNLQDTSKVSGRLIKRTDDDLDDFYCQDAIRVASTVLQRLKP